MTDQQLKLCPFCGDQPTLKQTGLNKITIKSNCGINLVGKHLKYSQEWLINKMIEKWNQRA